MSRNHTIVPLMQGDQPSCCRPWRLRSRLCQRTRQHFRLRRRPVDWIWKPVWTYWFLIGNLSRQLIQDYQINRLNSITDLRFSATDSEDIKSSQWPKELQSLAPQIEAFVFHFPLTMIYWLDLVNAGTILVWTSHFHSDILTLTMPCIQIQMSGKSTKQWQSTIHKLLYYLQLLTLWSSLFSTPRPTKPGYFARPVIDSVIFELRDWLLFSPGNMFRSHIWYGVADFSFQMWLALAAFRRRWKSKRAWHVHHGNGRTPSTWKRIPTLMYLNLISNYIWLSFACGFLLSFFGSYLWYR